MTIFKIEWKTEKKSVFIWSAAVMLLVVLFMFVFPTMKTSGMQDLVSVKLESLPEELMKIVNLKDMAKLLQVTGFFAYIFQYMFIAAAIFATMLGAQSLIKDETDGTIEYIYAQPVSRNDIVTGKLLANICMLFLFWFFIFIATAIVFIFFKESTDVYTDLIGQLLRIFSGELLVLYFFFAIGYFLSTILKSSKQATSVAMGLVFGTYIVGILSELKDNIAFLKYFSPINYAIPTDLIDAPIEMKYVLICVIGIAILISASFYFYGKKDFKI